MNIGLVLSGGFAKGAYELGALKAISEYFSPEDIRYISSASVGSLIAYAFSSGKLNDAFDMWRDINKYHKKLFAKTVLESDYFKSSIKDITTDAVYADKFFVSLLNLNGFRNCYVNLSGKDRDLCEAYLSASVALAPFVKPVLIDEKYFSDGAIIDNIPVFPLVEYELDYIFCIHFDKYNYEFESCDIDSKIIKIVFNDDMEILKKSIWFTRSDTEYMFENGYIKARQILEYVFINGKENLNEIYKRTKFLSSLRPKKQARLTVDIVANNVTKVTRKFAKTEVLR